MQFFIGIGVITGVVASAFGSWLSAWFQERRDAKRDGAIFDAFKEEVISNLEMLTANSVELESELKAIKDDKHLLTTLSTFQFSTWDILKTHIPRELSNRDVFRQLALTMHLVALVNSELEAREQFKINGAALIGFSATLAKRDQLLLERHVSLLQRIMELKKTLNLNISFNSPSKTLKDALKESAS